MADDEAESEPASKDEGTLSVYAAATSTSATVASPSTSAGKRNANAADCEDGTSGVRSIVIERSEYGFGFTLRHFIVYPPESSAILARDRHLGFRKPTMPNEPIDTIFVKNVRENGPAHIAGLATGDRIISVNGQDIGGLSYLRVVNLIFRTKGCLRLAVVPQQNDALQLFFGEAAHHPESNQKPRAYLADVASGYDHSPTSMISSNTRHYSRNDSNSLYQQQPIATTAATSRTFDDDVSSTSTHSCERRNVATWACSPPPPPPPMKSTTLSLLPTPSWSSVSQTASDASSCCSCESVNGVYPPSQMLPAVAVPLAFTTSSSSTTTPTLTPPAFNLNCTYSVDVEFDRNNYDSMSDSSLKDYLACDDSVVMNRLRKSLEQKQEFLNRLPCSTPAPETSVVSPTCRMAPHYASIAPLIASRPGIGDEANAPPPPPPLPPPPQSLPVSPNSGTGVVAADAVTPTFQIVSIRAKQFEKGAAVSDKTELFRSELARLSVKKNAVTVAARKRDLENRVQLDKRAASSRALNNAAAAVEESREAMDRNDRVVAQIRGSAGSSSGNQTIPVGSNKLHCEPPSEFRSFCPAKIEDDEKATRRISYLKATTAYSMNVDSENDLDDNEQEAPVVPQRSVLGSRKIAEAFPPDQEESPVIKEGSVFCKVIHVEGKKASDRSWKPIWLILKGCGLYLLKEKKESLLTETPATFDKTELGASCDRLDLRCSVVQVANDYTKRKHVFRLNAPSVGTELLLQAQDANSMSEWVRVLKEQAIVPVTSIEPVSTNFGTSVSPSARNKTLRKLASLRTRSPSGDVPSNKAKKPALNDYQQTSPKTKTWKNKMAKQFRKIQPGGNSPGSSAAISYQPGATIGIPLEVCPSSTFSEHVPLIVQVCTSIVEAKGLEIIGIYRVPGNTAAVTSLTEAVNRGLEMTALDQDPRWSDVNVISSLLKSFFRKLPDALLTSELYPNFIKSDAIEDPIQRMITIRKLVHDLPDHNFETLKYLLFHLKKVVANSAVNKMEARNLAIVFGPTLIRSGDDMFTMVTDMSHQCRIVESLLSHVDWCFGDGDIDDLKTNIPETNSMPELEASSSNHTLLLGNIRKVEECLQSPTTAKDFVSTIIGAANRKMHKTSKHLTGGGGGGGSSSSRKSAAAAAAAAAAAYTGYAISSGSEDALDSAVAAPSIPVVSKTSEKKQIVAAQSKTEHVSVENDNRALVTIPLAQVPAAAGAAQQTGKSTNDDQDQVSWTYPKLSAETKERIRKFEEETEALLQRCTNPRRLSGCISDEMDHKEKMSSSSTTTSTFCKPNERMVHDSPPPVVVTRRNLPSVCARNADDDDNCKKSTRVPKEFVRNNSMEKSTSLESLNRTGRPSSRHSDESCDLLMTLTSTFDKKLKSLSNDSSLCEKPGEATSRSECVSRDRVQVQVQVQVDRNISFRDPSLHRNVDKSCKIDTIQKMQTNITDKENGQHSEEKEKKDVDEKERKEKEREKGEKKETCTAITSCAACGCSVAHSEAIQQNCDNWKRTVLQEMQSQQNRLGGGGGGGGVKRGESKLFYSNSVKLRRSESLKEDGGAAATKLRRSGSLNKYYEPTTKMSKFESLMLIRNAEAIKLRRVNSLTKSEKTETNLKRRQHTQMENSRKIRGVNGGGGGGGGGGASADKEGKMKRRNGANKCRNIKRRHTVGGTKDFDKVSWLQRNQNERSACACAGASVVDQTDKENRRERRTSSPDLSSTKAAAAGVGALASAPEFLVEVVVRPRSFITATADPNFVSRLLKIPLESHV